MNILRKYGRPRIVSLLSGLFLLATTPTFSSCSDDAEEPDVLSILFEKSAVGLNVSGSEQLRIKVILPGKGVSQTDWYDLAANPQGLVWRSGNENAVHVDAQGVVTGIGTGNAPITVTAPNGVYARTSVSVSNDAIFERLKAGLTDEIVYSRGVQLVRNAVMQCFDVDSKGEIYYVQIAGTDAHELHVIRGAANEAPADYMTLRWFGHGTNMAVEEQGNDRYIWIGSNGNKLDDGSYSQNQTVSRVKYEAGKTLDCCAGETFWLEGKRNVHPAVDVASDMLAITASTTGVRDFYVYRLSEALALPESEVSLTVTSGGEDGTQETTGARTVKVRKLDQLTPVGRFTVNTGKTDSEVGYYDFQGFDCTNGIIYFYEGVGNDNDGKTASVAYVTLLDLTGAQAYPRTKVGAIADMQALTTAGITATGYMEAEGIKMKNGSLWLGFASKSTDDIRRANIFRY